ncbi:MAG: alpha-galactosidase [Clostridia bacterium]|nr:alpha-galactosidase [Clostridia bacterium]
MKYLKDAGSPLFSFHYNGKSFSELLPEVKATRSSNSRTDITEHEITYALPDGLTIVQSLREYPAYGACEWVLNFTNNSSERSGLISELNDCDASIEFEYDAPPVKPGFRVKDGTAKIFNPAGSNLARDEFCSKEQFILPGQTQKYANTGGRSSQGIAPFFDVNRQDKGVICAIGWTGQWQAAFQRNDNSVNIKTGIEAVAFRLLPGEKIRTSSIVLMTYEHGQNNGHNQFRRLVREHFSLIGKPGRPQNGPLCTMSWGAVPSENMISRIKTIAKHQFGFEYYWIDAAWYGAADGCSPSEFEGDWGTQTGNWQVNSKTHPDGLKDVAKAVKDNGMKFLLWIEPERVISTNPTPQKHPDWFFKIPGDAEEKQTWLLNLGNPEALEGTIELISGFIEELGLDCYRQDFNTDPLPYWRKNDEPERAGMNEIKHVMGLYKFWDTLLTRFPHLLIDNCASGGRRIDIELLRRSIPLWRSDYQCTWDCDPETTQTHNSGISWWLPYSGTGAGCVMGDTYRTRSTYTAALTTNYWGYEDWDISDAQPLEWVKRSNEEYKRARPYFSCDYYPLLPPSMDDSNWTAWQYDRPEEKDGIVMAFRRPKSPCEAAAFELGGVKSGSTYRFEDADTGELFEISSESLMKNGFRVCLPAKRSCKLYFYTAK